MEKWRRGEVRAAVVRARQRPRDRRVRAGCGIRNPQSPPWHQPLPIGPAPSYTVAVRSISWNPDGDGADQLATLVGLSKEPGLLVVVFPAEAAGQSPTERLAGAWIRSRAVTVADVRGPIGGGALEVALGCDLVFVRPDAAFRLAPVEESASPRLVWALARAGAGALARGLLEDGAVAAEEAVEIGLAHALVSPDGELPLPEPASVPAMTSARDLLRCRAGGGAGRALEMATFRLLFAAGDPEEGARAFLERRPPRFGSGGGDGPGDGSRG